jgi:hypothetical protein
MHVVVLYKQARLAIGWPLRIWSFGPLRIWNFGPEACVWVNGPTGRTPVFGFNDEWANRANTRYTAMNVPMPCKSLLPFSF